MKALILGCSHAAGAEMHKDPSIAFDNDDEAILFGWQNSYPVLMAKKLGYVPLNYAISGGSNDAMFRIFVEQLKTLESHDIVIACWTGIDRTEIWHELDQFWLPLSMGQHSFWKKQPSDVALSGLDKGFRISLEQEYKDYKEAWARFHTNLESNTLNKLKNLLSLNSLAQQYNIKVLNLDSFHPIHNIFPIENTELINWAWKEPFCEWADRNCPASTPWGHYFFEAHQRFADLVVEHLTKNTT
jgi:hypothetical protein